MAIERKFDITGRISIPKELRDKLGFTNNSKASIEQHEDKIIITNSKSIKSKKEIEKQLNKMKSEETYDDISYGVIKALEWVLNMMEE